MEESGLAAEISQELNNYLYTVFIELTSLYGNNIENLQKLLISLLVLKDTVPTIKNSIAELKANSNVITKVEVEEIKFFSNLVTQLSSFIQGNLDKIKKSEEFKKFNISDTDASAISIITIVAVKALIDKIDNDKAQVN